MLRSTRLLCLAAVVAAPTLVALPQPASAAGPGTPRMQVASTAVEVPTQVFVENITPVGLGVLVAWQPSPAAEKVSSYKVTASASGADETADASCAGPFTMSVDAQSTLARVSGLCAGVAYTASVVASNAAGAGPSGGESAPVAVLPAQVPAAPVVAEIVGRNGSIVVGWASALDDGGAALTGFRVTATEQGAPEGAAPAASVTALPGARTATLTGLTNGVTYDVAVVAVNEVGDSPPALEAAKPSTAYAPQAPLNLSATPDGNGSVVVAWSPPADDGGDPVTGYSVTAQQVTAGVVGEYTPTQGSTPQVQEVDGGARSVTFTGLAPSDGIFTISVQARNGVGSGEVVATPTPVTPTTAVTEQTRALSTETMSALASDVSGVLTWPAPVPAQVSALVAGDVVVAAPAAAAPQGLLRRVTGTATAADGSVSITTSVAAITDVFSSLALAQSSNPLLGPTPTSTTSSSPLMGSLRRQSAGGIFEPAQSGVATLLQPRAAGNLSTSLNASLNLSAQLEFGDAHGAFASVAVNVEPSIGATLDIRQNLVGAPTGFGVTLRAEADVSVSGNVGLRGEHSKRLGTIRGGSTVIMIGPVPVVIVPRMDVDLVVGGSVTVGAQFSMKIGGVVSYDSRDDQLRGDNTSTVPVLHAGPLGPVTAQGEVVVALRPTPRIALYDIFGPAFSPSLEAAVVLDPTAEEGDPFVRAELRLVWAADLRLELFGFKRQAGVKLGTTVLLEREYGRPPVTQLITPDVGKAEIGTPLTLTAARSDGSAARPVTWSVLGGVQGDRIDSAGVFTAAAPAGRIVRIVAKDDTGANGTATLTVGDGFDAPRSLAAAQAYDSLETTLSWGAPAQSAGSPIASYRITGGPDGPITVSASSRSHVFDELKPGTYGFTVYAYNTAGRASPPASVAVTVRPLCTHRASSAASWGDASAWSAGTVPSASSWVCIDTGQVSGPASAISVQGLQLQGGTLTTDVPITVSSSAVLDGELAGTGSVVVQPGVQADVQGLAMRGSVHLVNKGTLRVRGSGAALSETARIENHSQLLLEPSAAVGGDGTAGPQVTNAAGATLRLLGSATSSSSVGVPVANHGIVTTSGTLDLHRLTIAQGARFEGFGTIRAHAVTVPAGGGSITGRIVAAGPVVGADPLVVTSDGQLTADGMTLNGSRLVNEGAVRLRGYQGLVLTSGGVLDNAGRTILEKDSSVGWDAQPGAEISNRAGAELRYAGSADTSGALNVPVRNAGTLAVDGGGLSLSQLTLSGTPVFTGAGRATAEVLHLAGEAASFTGRLTASGNVFGPASLTVPAGAELTLAGAVLQGAHVQNDGVVVVRGYNGLQLADGSVLRNRASLLLQENTAGGWNGVAGTALVNEPTGTVQYVGSAGTTAWLRLPVITAGAMTAQDGTLVVSDLTIDGAPSFAGPGVVQAERLLLPGSAATFTGELSVTADLHGPAPLTVPSGATLTLASAVVRAASVVNHGLVRVQGYYGTQLHEGASVSNSGELLLEPETNLGWDGLPGGVTNTAGGVIRYAGGAGTTGSVTAPIRTSGRIASDGGLLSLQRLVLVGTPSFTGVGTVQSQELATEGETTSFTGRLLARGSATGPALTVPAGSQLTLANISLSGLRLHNLGTVRLRGSWSHYAQTGFVFTNDALLLVESGAYLGWYSDPETASITNTENGTVRYVGGSGTEGSLAMPLVNRGTLQSDGGRLYLPAASVVTGRVRGPGTVTVAGGTLHAAVTYEQSPTIELHGMTVSGTVDLTGVPKAQVSGDLRGADATSGLRVPAGSELALDSSSLTGVRLANEGTLRVGTYDVSSVSGGSVLDNAGVLLLESGAHVGWVGGHDASTIVNQPTGQIRATGGPGSTATVYLPLVNRGTVRADAGTLRLVGASMHEGSISGPGAVELAGSSLHAPVTFSDNPHLSLSQVTFVGAVVLADVGTTTASGSLTGADATASLTVPAGSQLSMSSSHLSQLRIVNRGAVRLQTYYAPYFSGASTLENHADVVIESEAHIGWAAGTDTSSIVNRSTGVIRYAGGEGSTAGISVPVANEGTIRSDAGELRVDGAVLRDGTVAGPGAVRLVSSTLHPEVDYAQAPVLSLSEVTLAGAVAFTGVARASVTGTLQGAGAGASLTIPAGSALALSSAHLRAVTVANDGVTTLSRFYAPYLSEGAVLENRATMLVEDGAYVSSAGGTDTAKVLNRPGATLRYVGGAGSRGVISAPLVSDGMLHVEGGVLQLREASIKGGVTGPGVLEASGSTLSSSVVFKGSPELDLTNTTLTGAVSLAGAPTTTLSGTVDGAGTASLTIPSGSRVAISSAQISALDVVNNGTVQLRSGHWVSLTDGSTLQNNSTVLMESEGSITWSGQAGSASLDNSVGGTVHFLGGPSSSGRISVPFRNAGVLHIDGGRLHAARMTTDGTAQTIVGISGPADEDAGALELPGGSSISGPLQLRGAAGYQPEAGSRWHVVRGTDLTGGHSPVTGAERTWSGSLTAAGFAVDVTGVAQPAPVPGDVGAVSASPSAGAASATWAAPAAGGTAESYEVSVEPGGILRSVQAPTTSLRIPGLMNGAEHTVRVRAVNSHGAGPWSIGVAVTPNGCAQTRFGDVLTGGFCPNIAWMVQRSISTGTVMPDGEVQYRPAAGVSRQAMAPFLYRASGSPAFSPPAEPSFADVPTSHAFYKEIEWMYARRISTGTPQPDGKPLYKPLDAVSRQAMAPFLYRALGSPAFTAPAEPTFGDVPLSHAFFKEVEWMYAQGISTGTPQPDGKPLYKPGDQVTRQAMAAFLNRAYT